MMNQSGIDHVAGWSPLESFWDEEPAGIARKQQTVAAIVTIGRKRSLEDVHENEALQFLRTPGSQSKRQKVDLDVDVNEGNLQDAHSAAMGETLLLCTEESNDPLFWRPVPSVSPLPPPPPQQQRTEQQRAALAFRADHAGFSSYVCDIYLHRRSIELKYHPINCLAKQPQVTPEMRAMLVDWLTKVLQQFQFAMRTLFVAVNIIDRFLGFTPITSDCFQLLGVTALLIAGKVEEVCPPEIAELVGMCCDAYSRHQVRQLELLILMRLDAAFAAPTAHFFLEHHAAERIHGAPLSSASVDQCRQTRALGRFLLEQSLQDYSLCQHAPSVLALSTLEIADEIMCHRTRPGSLYAGGYSAAALEDCATELRCFSSAVIANCDLEDVCTRYACLDDCEDY